MQTPEKKSFWSLMVVQFFGAFNDNLFKILVSLLIVQWVASNTVRNQLVDLSGAIFVAPFLIFSMIAGRFADRISKSRVITGVQYWQLLVVAVAGASLLAHSIYAILLAMFLLSMQAAFFSPAKYGILPELMDETELSDANGLLNMGTFTAIIVGTIAASFLSDKLKIASTLLLISAVVAILASYWVKPLPAAKPEEPLQWNPWRVASVILCLLALGWFQTLHHRRAHLRLWGSLSSGLLLIVLTAFENAPDLTANWAIIKKDRTLKLGIIAVNYFWFMGAVLQLNIFLYAKEMMNATPEVSGFLLMAVAVGIGLGSFLAGKFSKEKVELGLVPLGAVGMSLFAIDLFWAFHSLYRTMADLFMLGFSGGFYEVPLSALVQWRSPKAERGRVLATVNFFSFVAILGASAVLWILGTRLHLNPAQVLFTLGILSLVGTITVYSFLPDAVWRLVLYAITNTIYKIRVEGADNVPTKGPALLVCNHLSLADGFLVGGALGRLVQFLIWRPYYEARSFHWLAKTLKAIPISEMDSPRAIAQSLIAARDALKAGNLVCVFAEGQISRTGNLLEFKRGFEVIAKDLDIPIVPVHLDRVWGSIFSFEHGRVIFKKPRRIPYPITVTFGRRIYNLPKPKTPFPAVAQTNPPPQSSPTRGEEVTGVSTAQIRQAVLDLGADAFKHRIEELQALPVEFLKRAKRYPGRLAVADSSGKKLSFGQLAAVSAVTAQILKKELPSSFSWQEDSSKPAKGMCIGILLPASVAGAVANLAVSFMGRIPVNLNYTAGAAAIEQAMTKAGITRILTSRKLLEKTGLPATAGMLYMEDLLDTLPRDQVVLERILFSCLPTSMVLSRFMAKTTEALDETATIIFSSGSTGVPKGVMLSHTNILSNILGLSQVFDVGKNDTMLGVLPFFHSFGFTATLWFPLLSGFAAVYHSNPLDAQTVGELTEKYKATFLLTTPTFLLAYTRKCLPVQLKSLRFVVTGAERLRESIAEAFEEKFGLVPLEGYGCTELSPVATVNVPDISMGEITQVGHKTGKIGQPIPGVSVKIVDPDSFAPLPQGEKGLLLVKGMNVMKGYLGDPKATQQVIKDGWYVTGDIARVDPDGFVQIVDRLSRFSKIGGEMVPHVLVEEKLHDLAGRSDPTFVVTAIPDEKRGEQLVVLYADYSGSLDPLFEKLNASDLPKLWIPARNRFFEIPEIPYLGSGKLDLAKVKEIALSLCRPGRV